jgi:hypothetical protein
MNNPLDFVVRAQAIKVRMDGLVDQARRAAERGDVEGTEAAKAEAELLLDNLREVRLEQLAGLLEPIPEPKPRRWWQFWLSRDRRS